MTTDMKGQGDVRFLALMQEKIKGPFFSVCTWMHGLGLSRSVTNTYACVHAFTRVGMQTSVHKIAAAVRLTDRSVAKHLRTIREAGLWQVVRRCELRGTQYMLGANQYIFLWHKAMGDEWRGAPVNGGYLMRSPEDEMGVPRVTQVNEDLITDLPVQSGTRSLSERTALLMNSEKTSEQAGNEWGAADLPKDLQQALQKLDPRNARDSLRVVRERCAPLPKERARAVSVLALRKLVSCIERGGVKNPAGLLRASILDETIEEVDGLERGPEGALTGLRRFDSAVANSRSGRLAIVAMRERARAIAAIREHHPDAVVSVPCAEDPALCDLLGGVAALLARESRAVANDDGLTRSSIADQLYKLESRYDTILAKRRGRAS
jgi:DNA-binding transcriptional ArsR family regulator